MSPHTGTLVCDDYRQYKGVIGSQIIKNIGKLRGNPRVVGERVRFSMQLMGPQQVRHRGRRPVWKNMSCYVNVLIDVLKECNVDTVLDDPLALEERKSLPRLQSIARRGAHAAHRLRHPLRQRCVYYQRWVFTSGTGQYE